MTLESNINKIKTIFLIEDDDIDIMVFKRVLKKLDFPHTLQIFTNGEEYLKFIEENPTEPDIMFLDLNTPRMNGIDLLKYLTKITDRKYCPVIVVSTSVDENDIREAYKYMANGYIVKSIDFNTFLENMFIVLKYWDIVHIPKGVANE